MRVLYLVNTYPRASHSFIRREIRALEARGIEVMRLAMRSDRGGLVDPLDLEEDSRTEHLFGPGQGRRLALALAHLARHPRRAAAGLGLAWRLGARAGAQGLHLVYLVEAAHVARRAAAGGARHIHAHFGTGPAAVAALAGVLGGAGYSFTTHGPEEFDAPAQLSLAEKVARARFAVAVSSYGRAQLCRWSDPADWQSIHVVHCGIEPTLFGPPAPLPPGGPHLVAVGRLAAQKGFGLLIEALALAAPTAPGLRLTLVGEGELRPALEAAIARHGLGARVHLAGWQDEAGVRAALAGAQALILPSFAEGLPVVAMEAMAAGRPVIATAIAGLPELVTPDCGWLVPAGDAMALADAITRLAATSPETLRAMGEAARARALSRHDAGAEAARLATLFKGYAG